MKKILVILTGGTIGSQSSEGILNTGEGSAAMPLDFYFKKYGGETEFETVTPLVTLSENINCERLGVIMKTIDKNKDRNDVSGIIVTHGSDTLSYTSNLAGLLFSKTKLPIVFVAGNKELSDESGNGLDNFKNAVDFICVSGEKGVFVSWSNEPGDNTVYFAADLCEADGYFDRFSSYDGRVFGRMKDGSFAPENDAETFEFDPKKTDFNFEKKVLLIKPYPGLDYSSFDITKYSAVVHYLYHSSTACVEGNENSVLDFIEKCERNGVRFFVAPIKKSSGKIYSSLEKILKHAHVEKLTDCSIERAYAHALLEVNK